MQKHKGLIPGSIEQMLKQIGANIDLARKRRKLSVATVCSRTGITSQTYYRLANGESGVSMGVLGSVLSALDLESTLEGIAAPEADEVGLTMERSHQPKRIHEGEQGHGLDTEF